MLELQALLHVPYIELYNGFDISPKRTKVAFSWNRAGQWEIYELSLSGTEAPQQVSRGRGAKFAPKYSPDGCRLAYALDLDGSESYHLVVHDLEGGSVHDMTPDIPFALQPNFAWSPGGTEIAFLSDRSGCFSAYVMSADAPRPWGEGSQSEATTRRLMLETGRPAWEVKWSPDGRWLAVVTEGPGQDFNIHLVAAKGGEAHLLADKNGALNAGEPAWSPDGKKLAFAADPHGHYDIGVLAVETLEITWLTTGDGDKTTPAWSPDGERLAYVLSQGAQTRLAVQAAGKVPRHFCIEPGIHHRPAFAADGKHILFGFESPRQPPDLWSLSLADGNFQALTDSLPEALREAPFVMPEEITYPGMDGTPIPALLYRPPQAGRHSPAVINIHGGPDWHFSFHWNPFMAHAASRGWTVLAPNYRGSTGYGRAWQNANRLDLGGVDTRDCAAGAHYLIGKELTDPRHIAVTGRSHGGYLTMTCLTQYPDLWAAGSAVVPFLNWFTAQENSRADLRHWAIENLGDPEENHELWRERSPYFFLERVCAPVQLICGENDPRCPPSESLAAYDRLGELGREVDLKLYEGEGHAFLKTENVTDAEMRRVDFLAKALE